jgi:hypothetical protein
MIVVQLLLVRRNDAGVDESDEKVGLANFCHIISLLNVQKKEMTKLKMIWLTMTLSSPYF